MSEDPTDTPVPQTPHAPWWRSEDWIAVFMAAILIGAALLGWKPAWPKLGWSGFGDLGTVFSGGNLKMIGTLGLLILPLAAIGAAMNGVKVAPFVAGYVVVFGLAVLAVVLAEQKGIKTWGIEYVVFALLLGLTLRQLNLVPDWVLSAARSEFYVKTGLVILGTSIVFQELMKAGVLGVVQSLLVVFVVWQVAFYFCKKLKVDEEFAVILSSAVAICGVSAAIAACGAIRGDRRKLSYTTSLVLICAVPMMVLMPWAVKWMNLSDLVGGAWMGGTLDTTASVTAAAQQISEPAMKLGTIVKFSQNVLMGVAAFVISLWWAMRPQARAAGAEKPTAGVIWERFPKFVLGFLIASLIFSFAITPAEGAALKPGLTALRNVWFALAFVSIGLETRLKDLVGLHGARPAVAFIGAQGVNVIWTLILAWIFFSGKFFAVPVFN